MKPPPAPPPESDPSVRFDDWPLWLKVAYVAVMTAVASLPLVVMLWP